MGEKLRRLASVLSEVLLFIVVALSAFATCAVVAMAPACIIKLMFTYLVS